MKLPVFITIVGFALVSCGVVKPIQYTAIDEDCLPERVKFNLNYSDEELAELDKMKLRYFPAYYESDDTLLNTLLDSLIDSHLKSFAPSKLDPVMDWKWYQGADKFFADYYTAMDVQYDSLDFDLKDLAVERMDKINFDPTCGWQPGMNMNASVDGLLAFYQVHSMYDRLLANPHCSEDQRRFILEDYYAWSKLNSAMYLLLSGYTAINASYSSAPMDLNIEFKSWCARRIKELEQEYMLVSGKRCRILKADIKVSDFLSLKSFYLEHSDPYFIEAIANCLDDWMEAKEKMAQTMTGAHRRRYLKLAQKEYMRIFNELEFMTKIWY